MGAHEALSQDQFGRLPAHEIIANWDPGDRLAKDKSTEDVWKRKLAATEQGHRAGMVIQNEDGSFQPVTMREHVRLKGVSKPVVLQDPASVEGGRPKVLDGHHRIAAAWDAGYDVPYTYASGFEEMRAMRGGLGVAKVRKQHA